VRIIVGGMGRLEALKSMRYYRPLLSPDHHNPLREIQVQKQKEYIIYCYRSENKNYPMCVAREREQF
jgi:hypothetical protein